MKTRNQCQQGSVSGKATRPIGNTFGLRLAVLFAVGCFVSTPITKVSAEEPSAEVIAELQLALTDLQTKVDSFQADETLNRRDGKRHIADVAIFAKAVEWMLRHNEFPKKGYAEQAVNALKTGNQRAIELQAGQAPWELRTGTSVRGYISRIDGSVQPYAITLPEGVDPKSGVRWPVHVKLHGRANHMNEVNFIHRHEGKPLPKGQNWIQIDVYGRGNNAYRWAGETDVFEALSDVGRRFRLDNSRITLHGFSMGGAGAWHLGMHYPSMWSSVGPGAGFVDFYKYQNQKEQRPPWQHENLGIYDAIDYALNAANVPVCTYGGENDSQLVASTSMVEAAKALGVDIKLLVGPGMGHKFHPDSFKEFMEFHQQKSLQGTLRNQARSQIRFTTRTLKYNKCDWLTVEEVEAVYKPSTVEAKLTKRGNAEVSVTNVAVFSVARDVAQFIDIAGQLLPCYDAAEGLLPNVFYEKTSDGWQVLDYQDSMAFQDNNGVHKRRNLQGPIDDAFMESFVCVEGSGESNSELDQWASWTLGRFEREFDKWMRARIKLIDDTQADSIDSNANLILFGSPASNAMIRKLLPGLPIKWSGGEITVGNQVFSTTDHAVSLIYPNPRNPRRYVVINSGHTFHEPDFNASNSWLFPRLGDIAIQKFTKNAAGGFDEETVWAANFNSGWKLSE